MSRMGEWHLYNRSGLLLARIDSSPGDTAGNIMGYYNGLFGSTHDKHAASALFVERELK